MHVTDYSKYYKKAPEELSSAELKHLLTYFELLGQVQNPIVSLVIPVFRAKDSLLAHICSLSHLKTIIPYEVIFVDNNADRETLKILNTLGAKIVKEERQGITHARQKGLEASKGGIICTMDPDSIYDRYYIDKMVLPFFDNPNVVMCYSVSKSYEKDFRLSQRMQIRNWLKVKYFSWRLTQSFENSIKYIRAVAMSIRKEAIISFGYPTDLKAVSGCDDGMLAMQLNTVGAFKFVDVDVYTALPPPREPGRPFPFCNERFLLKKPESMERTMQELEIEKAPK
ncbi:MAG: glycosyltransferase family A protein [Bacteroidota bacterium]